MYESNNSLIYDETKKEYEESSQKPLEIEGGKRNLNVIKIGNYLKGFNPDKNFPKVLFFLVLHLFPLLV